MQKNGQLCQKKTTTNLENKISEVMSEMSQEMTEEEFDEFMRLQLEAVGDAVSEVLVNRQIHEE